jgi:hypothetical protein
MRKPEGVRSAQGPALVPCLRPPKLLRYASWRWTTNKTTKLAALAALTVLSVGCSLGGEANASDAADTLTRRQKNEIISTLPVPGARGVGRALEATDLVAARVRGEDSLSASLTGGR